MTAVERIEELQQRLRLGQGEIYRIARDVVGEEVASLYQLAPSELDRLVCYLDQLACVA